MDLPSAKMIGAGIAVIALAGVGAGIGNIFASLISAIGRNPAARGQVIQRLNTASVSLSSSPNPSSFGQDVAIVASVTGGAGTPTGTVRFRDGPGDIYGCTAVPLSGGSATCHTDGLASGSHSLNAVYSGDPDYNEATSGSINQSVGPTPSPARSLVPS